MLKDWIGFSDRQELVQSIVQMGCQPSRRFRGRVADFATDSTGAYLKQFDKAFRKQRRILEKNRMKSTCVSTSRVYNRQSRLSRVTVRLSADGSMLEIEQHDLDLIKGPIGDMVPEVCAKEDNSEGVTRLSEDCKVAGISDNKKFLLECHHF